MKLPENNDPLDALLQEENRYVPDDGFTNRIIASLPSRRRRRLPGFLLLTAAMIGSIAAAIWLPWEHLPSLSASALFALNSEVLLPWLTVSLVAASLAWAVLAALQWED